MRDDCVVFTTSRISLVFMRDTFFFPILFPAIFLATSSQITLISDDV